MTYTMAIDQYGNHFDDLGKHPRKELLSRLDRKRADKIYRDKTDGTVVHVGYIIAGLWLKLYHVRGWGEDE